MNVSVIDGSFHEADQSKSHEGEDRGGPKQQEAFLARKEEFVASNHLDDDGDDEDDDSQWNRNDEDRDSGAIVLDENSHEEHSEQIEKID